LAFGVNVGCLDSRDAPPFAYAFDRANVLTASRFFDIFWQLKRMFGVGCEKELASHLKTINDYVYDIITQRKKESENNLETKQDFLSRFLQIRDEKGESPSDQYLRDMIVNFMLAGRDTTASGLSWTIFHLFQHPHVVERAREEIASFVSPSSNEIVKPTYDQLKDMVYLHAIFSEAIRLHPPVPSDGKTAREDDVLPSGTVVKAGYMVSFMPYSMGRLPDLWENPLEFRPERWIDEDGKFRRESLYKVFLFFFLFFFLFLFLFLSFSPFLSFSLFFCLFFFLSFVCCVWCDFLTFLH
jgi:cytochrome P450